ncbi:MAG: hypothetical protein DRI95_00755 [Bacteroidetes bacterium]|nr:MAG: hypothetical protein DRI95_00755 [Bacteroidota bacterium]
MELINIQDVRVYRQLSKQVNEDNFKGHVKSVQDIELYNLLGQALFSDFFANITEQKYIDLWHGKDYIKDGNTIKYEGLNGFLSWHFLASYITDGNLKQADVGNINILGDMFSGANSYQLKDAKSEYLQNAQRESNKIVDYLNANKTDFALWRGGAIQQTTGLDFGIN